MAEEGGEDQPEQEVVLFYARALYSYEPLEDTEIGFEEAGKHHSSLLFSLSSSHAFI